MATFTAIRNQKQAPSALLNVLNYVADAKKTRWGDALLVTGHNCVPQSSFIEMQMTTRKGICTSILPVGPIGGH